MADIIQQNNYIKFITNLVTAIRQISIYPPKHPIIVNSIKGVFVSLEVLLKDKSTLNLNLSPDNKILVDGEAFSDKSSWAVQDIIPYFKKMDIEGMIFDSGITEKEIDEFIRVILSDSAEIKSGDLNKLLLDKGIQHVMTKQFSYLKVEKGKEAFLVEGEKSQVFESLKSRLKDYCADKIEKPEDIQSIEQAIFNLISVEFKEKNKLSPSLKNIFKKFILHNKDKDGTLSKLKNALLDYGCPAQEVDNLVNKITEEISRGVQIKKKEVAAGDIDEFKNENRELKLKLDKLQEEVEAKTLQVQQLEKQNKRVFDEKGRIDNIIHNLAEGMVVVDSEGKILLVNSTAESLLGITKEDIGKPIKEVIKDEHLLTLTKNIAIDKDGVVEKDIELLSPDESTKRVLRASSAVVEDNNGNTVGMVTMLNDITKQKEIEKLKSEFLSNVSHELRTPLVAIEKSVSLILTKSAGEVSETQNQFLSIAERNLKRLALLINDLLDLSKLEARKMELKRETVVLENIINDSIETLNNWAKTKSIKLEKVVHENVPQVNIDPNRIIQVLNNLIGNAIKFTPEDGSITVEVSKSQQEDSVRVVVADTGAGISPDDLVKIFEKFYQTKERAPTDISGTGIGLAIVKEIVELHGGKVWAESEKGHGGKFIFTLPLSNSQNNVETGG
jgi:PAS domain S-box-containing protein